MYQLILLNYFTYSLPSEVTVQFNFVNCTVELPDRARATAVPPYAIVVIQ